MTFKWIYKIREISLSPSLQEHDYKLWTRLVSSWVYLFGLMPFIVPTTSVVPFNMKISWVFVQHRPHFMYLTKIKNFDFRPVEPEVLKCNLFIFYFLHYTVVDELHIDFVCFYHCNISGSRHWHEIFTRYQSLNINSFISHRMRWSVLYLCFIPPEGSFCSDLNLTLICVYWCSLDAL